MSSAAPWVISGIDLNSDQGDRIASIHLGDDIYESSINSVRPKRYILAERKWPYSVITWKLSNDHLNAGDRYAVRNALHRAFYLWQSVCSLRFYEIPEERQLPANINVIFAKGAHGDKLPFDGRDGVVAHAFYPTAGKLHFDADEKWTLNRHDGINLYQTAVHEIGHIIGLEHSTDERAVMFPSYRPYDPDYSLADDDVRGIRNLYPLKRDHEDVSPLKGLNALNLKADEWNF